MTADRKEKKVRMWFYLILGLVVGVVLLFIIFSLFFGSVSSFLSNSNSINYNGLVFTREKFQNIDLFHYTYYSKDANGGLFKNNIYLRIDPRKNNVPVEGSLTFEGDRQIYSTIDTTGLLNCSDILRDVSFIPTFFVNNFYKVKIGAVNETEAKESNVSQITCEKYPDEKVVFIRAADETKITRKGNCYTINVANCELLAASEKFEVQSLLDSKAGQLNQ